MDGLGHEQGKMKDTEHELQEQIHTEAKTTEKNIALLKEEMAQLHEAQMFTLRKEQDTCGGNNMLDHSMEERLETKLTASVIEILNGGEVVTSDGAVNHSLWCYTSTAIRTATYTTYFATKFWKGRVGTSYSKTTCVVTKIIK